MTLTKFDLKNVVQPDIVVVCDPEKVDAKGRYHGTPTLVVEVLSKSTMRKDMSIKANLYLNSGIKEFWIVNPFNKDAIIYLNGKRENDEYLEPLLSGRKNLLKLGKPGQSIHQWRR